MMDLRTSEEKRKGSLWGLCIGDALAMPVHWYYNRSALFNDYGFVTEYLAPCNPHPDSILFRSHYTAAGPRGEILHDQAQYWGQKGIHYHLCRCLRQTPSVALNSIRAQTGVRIASGGMPPERGALSVRGSIPGTEVPRRTGEGARRQHQPGLRQCLPRRRAGGAAGSRARNIRVPLPRWVEGLLDPPAELSLPVE
jgi:hypothetical protein